MSEEPFLARRIDGIAASGAANHGELFAVRDERHALTFAGLDRAVDAARNALAAAGVQRGHRVVVVGGNCAATVVLFMAISRLGAWSVMTSDRLATAEIDAIVAHCAPRLVVRGTIDAARGSPVQTATRLSVGDLGDVPVEQSAPRADVEPDAHDIASLLYTSGTTGAPKAVMLSHANLLHVARTQARVRRYAPGDRTYCALPIAHAGGLASITLGTLAGGGCLQLAGRFDPEVLEAALRVDGVTVLPGVPALHVKFAEWMRAANRELDAPRLRMVTTASSPLQEGVKAMAESLYRLPLQNGYGLTETTALVCQTQIDRALPDTSVGAPFPGVRVRLVADDGTLAREGDVGEVHVVGPNRFVGYYRNDVASQSALSSDGWFATGDLARAGPDGRLFIVGRRKDLIKHSSFSVYPVEVESALEAHPAVALCCVVGRAGVVDEDVIAFVELRAGARESPDALRSFAATRLAAYKRPSAVHILSQLPTLHNGKVDKASLRRLAVTLGA